MNLPKINLHIGALWGIFIVLAIVIGLSTYLIDQYVSQFVYNRYVASLKTEADSFELALQQGLIQNDFILVQQLLNDLGLQRSVSSIRLLNANGVVRASSISAEVGVQLNMDSPTCIMCHSTSGAPLPFHQQIPEEGSGELNVLIANVIDNRVTCQGCHTDGKPTRGVILVEYDGENMLYWQKNFATGVYTGGSIILIALFGALALVYHYNVSQPLRKLQDESAKTRLMDRSDEIGAVARRMMRMEEALQVQEDQAAARRINFRALISISESLGESISVESVLRTALSTIQEVTGFSTVAMRFFDTSQNCLRLVVQNGMSPRMVSELDCITQDMTLFKALMSTRRIVRLSDEPSPDTIQIHSSSKVDGYQTTLSVPFLFGEQIMGSMELGSRVALNISEDQIRWLEVVGRVIGGLLHQVVLMEKLKSMTMLQERAHVAQEIHDGLVQMLGSLRMWAEEAQLALEEGNDRALQSAIRKIETTAGDAYSSLREEMLGLRDTLQTGRGMLPVLREYLMRFRRQWGIESKLIADIDDEKEGTIVSSPAVEIQLLRMIQEGLTNVRRHSRATSVQVQILRQDHMLVIEIRDNGTGFDPDNISEEKLGLRIMRERAEQIGGNVSVDASPGKGTRLIINVPR